MTSTIAKKLGRSVFASHVTALEPPDPIYETSIDPKTGKQNKKRRALPTGLTKKEEKILLKVRKRARCLDKGFSLCGFRFGWTAIIGLIPVVGDVVDAALSYYLVIRQARKCDLPNLLVQRMLLNQAVSTSIGLVPLVGDLLMAVWKVNSRNAALFEDFLIARGQHATSSNQASAKVPPNETARLVENSKKTSYVDGMTGEREPIASSSSPLGTSNQASTSIKITSEAADPTKKPRRNWFGLKKA